MHFSGFSIAIQSDLCIQTGPEKQKKFLNCRNKQRMKIYIFLLSSQQNSIKIFRNMYFFNFYRKNSFNAYM